MRVDLNVPIKNGNITETSRIEKIIPTIKLLIEKQAKIIVLSHIGRPKGKVIQKMSLEPISKKLASLLNKEVLFNKNIINENTLYEVNKIPNGSIMMLENIRFNEGEESNDNEFAKKIYAAKSVSKDMLVIARTDAKAVEGIDSAIERAKLYKDAGADIIFPEALETEEEFKFFAESVNGEMLANMTEFGKTPYYPAEKFADMGYKIIIYPVSSLRTALNAISDLFDEIMKTGTQVKFVEDMLTRKDLYNLINYDSYVKMDESLGGDDLISK